MRVILDPSDRHIGNATSHGVIDLRPDVPNGCRLSCPARTLNAMVAAGMEIH
jgi:hypothetical protein